MSIFNMKDQIPHPSRQSERGFSLIEVAIALAIIGLLLVPFIHQYNVDAVQKRINLTQSNIATAKGALAKYVIKYGRYPRPARPSIPSGSVVDGLYSGSEAPIPTANCATDIPTECYASSLRDVDGDGVPEQVYVGTIPFMTIGITEDESLDGWGNKLGYTVTADLTVPATYDDNTGVIRIRDAGNTPLGSDGNNLTQVMIVSHGEDGKGAFSLSGVLVSPCGTTATSRDAENCDNDGDFDDGTITIINPNTGLPERNVSKALGNTPAFWNDYYGSIRIPTSDFWLPIANDQNMSNRNPGAIRINTEAGDDAIRVEVDGTTRATGTGVYADELCGTSMSSNCISPYIIGRDTAPPIPISTSPSADTTGIRCPANTALQGISQGNQVCDNTTSIGDFGSLVFTPCTPGQYPRGITAAGVVFCEPP